jgi:hypothetical protein
MMDALFELMTERSLEIERLKAENAKLREENTDLEERIIKYWKECDLFEDENARLREALKEIEMDSWDCNKYGVHAWDRAWEALKGVE